MELVLNRVLLVVGVACLVSFPARGADPAADDAAPWQGQPRSEIIRLLGPPTKAKAFVLDTSGRVEEWSVSGKSPDSPH